MVTAQRIEPEYKQTDVLTVEQAARFLNVSAATVRHHCRLHEGEPERLPHFRLGTAIRLPYWGLLQWVAARSGAGMPDPLATPELRSVESSETMRH